jgi:hypothetical protein
MLLFFGEKIGQHICTKKYTNISYMEKMAKIIRSCSIWHGNSHAKMLCSCSLVRKSGSIFALKNTQISLTWKKWQTRAKG